MYSMKEVCDQLDMTYDTLKFYCNSGLVPNVQRDKNNYRVFDEHMVKWISSLQCLKKCGMSIKDMKAYLDLCLKGPDTIDERYEMMENQKQLLNQKLLEINECLAFIDKKQKWYRQVQAGEVPFESNLIDYYHEENN